MVLGKHIRKRYLFVHGSGKFFSMENTYSTGTGFLSTKRQTIEDKNIVGKMVPKDLIVILCWQADPRDQQFQIFGFFLSLRTMSAAHQVAGNGRNLPGSAPLSQAVPYNSQFPAHLLICIRMKNYLPG